MFGETIVDGAMIIKSIVEEHESCSRQRVYLDKSLVYFSSKIQPYLRGHITKLLGIRNNTNLKKYLGLARMVGRNRKETFQGLVD